MRIKSEFLAIGAASAVFVAGGCTNTGERTPDSTVPPSCPLAESLAIDDPLCVPTDTPEAPSPTPDNQAAEAEICDLMEDTPAILQEDPLMVPEVQDHLESIIEAASGMTDEQTRNEAMGITATLGSIVTDSGDERLVLINLAKDQIDAYLDANC